MRERLSWKEIEQYEASFVRLVASLNTSWTEVGEDRVKEISAKNELVSHEEWRRTLKDRIALEKKYQSEELKFSDNDPRKEIWELCQKFRQFPLADDEIINKSGLSESQQNNFRDCIDSLRKLRTKYEWPWQTTFSLEAMDHDIKSRSDRIVDLSYVLIVESILLETTSKGFEHLGSLMDNQFDTINGKHKVSNGIFKPSDSSECWVMVDSQYLYTIIDNLVGNSVKYSGKDLTDLAVFEWVGISEDEKVRIIYADNGAGFDHKMLERVDGKSRALKKGETTKGTGLGLWLVDNYISEMGGRVNLLNARDLGIADLGAVTVIDFPIQREYEQSR